MANEEHLDIILKQGVEAWNQWRKEHPEIEPDLSEANCWGDDLRGANLSKTNLHQANLSKTDLTLANLSGANLSGANLSGAFADSDVGEANLSGANLSGANLHQVYLNEANLTYTNLSGADLSGANLEEANLTYTNLSGANLWRAYLRKANLTYTNLSGANLMGAHLFGADLSGADLSNAIIVATDLSTVRLSKTNFNGAYLLEQQQKMLARDTDVIGVYGVKAVTLPSIIMPNSSNTIQKRRATMPMGTNSEHSASNKLKNPRNELGPPDIAHLIEEMSRLSTRQKNEIAKQACLTRRTPKTMSFWKDIMAGGVAILAVLGFAALIILIATLLSNATMNDVQWERYTYLLAGVETVTFTAIGWLFGKEVHREQAEQAELRANETQKAMETVAEENARGRMVAKGVMAHADDPNMKPLVEMVHAAYPDM